MAGRLEGCPSATVQMPGAFIFVPMFAKAKLKITREKIMLKYAIAGLALAVVSTAHAMPLAPMPEQESLTITVRAGCGAGFTMVNGRCIRTPARGAVRRGAVRN